MIIEITRETETPEENKTTENSSGFSPLFQRDPIEVLKELAAAGTPELDAIIRLSDWQPDEEHAVYEHICLEGNEDEYFLLVHRFKGKSNRTEIAYSNDRIPAPGEPFWERHYLIPVPKDTPEVD